MVFEAYTEQKFKKNSPGRGQINLLISGELDPLTSGRTPGSEGNPPTWNTGSWDWGNTTTGTLSSDGKIVGVCVSNWDEAGNDRKNSYRICETVRVDLNFGDYKRYVDLKVKERTVYTDYTYFKVEDYSLGPINNIEFRFKKQSETFGGYDCTGSNNPHKVVLDKEWNEFEQSNFNILIGSVINNRLNTITRKVEYVPFEVNSIQMYKEETTDLVAIPDSFYTSFPIISSRFLGSKNTYTKQGIEFNPLQKASISSASLQSYSSSVVSVRDSYYNQDSGSYVTSSTEVRVAETGKDRAFFTVQPVSGSVAASDTKDDDVYGNPLEEIGFVKRAVYSEYISGSNRRDRRGIKVNERPLEFLTSGSGVGDLPVIGDILYNAATSPTYRLTNVKVYVPVMQSILKTNNVGHIESILRVSEVALS